MNVHIFHDDKFTNGAIEQFEQAYPGQNCYIILLYEQKVPKYTISNASVLVFHIRDIRILLKIGAILKSEERYCRLFIHYMDEYKAALANRLLNKYQHLQSYWIFYGGDLYDYLARYKTYEILDDSSQLRPSSYWARITKEMKYLALFGMTRKAAKTKIFKRLDFFCFWNEYDYDLFRSKIDTNAQYKNFIYYNALGNPDYINGKKKNIIMVNHAASFSGNHLFVLDKLKNIRDLLSNYQILLPLSYGNKTYATKVIKAAKECISNNVNALTDFLPLPEYQSILAEVKIAIFGMRRQEAAGNIFQLINMGAKVFLRKENTLLLWLQKRNFIVFCLEEDEEELAGLQELSVDQIEHNQQLYRRYFNMDTYREMMQELTVDSPKTA